MEDDDVDGESPTTNRWTKGVADPNSDSRVNIWSLNGYGQPVFTGGLYRQDEAKTLERTVKDYCASKNVTLSELCGGHDHKVHNKSVRGAWQEIARCLPHRTVLSVYRRALRQFHTLTRGPWSKEEVASLFRLVELHGHHWKTIQDKLGRSAIDCRVKFFDVNDQRERGKWSVENVQLLLQKVRAALNVPQDDMDVREINQWTLEHKLTIPWTSISHGVNRRRTDCYFKWKQMTKRSNKKAIELGLEPVPMARESLKFDVRREYYLWKAEIDPKWRQKYTEEFVIPFLQKDGGGDGDDQKEKDMQLLDSIIESRASRPSEVSWQSLVQRGEPPRERWEYLVDKHATDADMDLPLYKLAKILKDLVSRAVNESSKPDVTKEKASSDNETQGNHKNKSSKKRKRKKQSESCEPSSVSADELISGVSTQQLRKAIRDIIGGTANLDELTVKGVRKRLEKQLGIDLSSHKSVVKKMVKEEL